MWMLCLGVGATGVTPISWTVLELIGLNGHVQRRDEDPGEVSMNKASRHVEPYQRNFARKLFGWPGPAASRIGRWLIIWA